MYRKTFFFCFAALVAVAAAGCFQSYDPAPDNWQANAQSVKLKPINSCPDLLDRLRARAMREMETKLDQNLEAALNRRCYGYGNSPGGGSNTGFGIADAGAGPSSGNNNNSSGSSGSNGPSQHSETNNQVAGVDEADFIKNDGAYIYIIANGRFKIIDAWPAADARVVSTTAVEGTPTNLFVTEDRALIYSGLEPVSDTNNYYDPWGYGTYRECTHGYDCDFTGDGQKLKITVLDITDRSRPTLLREIRFSGSYLNSRRVGPAIHTAVVFPPTIFPYLEYWPEGAREHAQCERSIGRLELMLSFANLRKENTRRIMEADIIDWIPGIVDTRYVDGRPLADEQLLESCKNFYESGHPKGQSYLTLVSLDITGTEPVHTATIVGKPGAVYASADALYVASRNYAEFNWWDYNETENIPQDTSTVHKFRLQYEPIGSTYAGTGLVKGRVLNQFSMDEHEGYFRIATTTGSLWFSGLHSTLSVLAERNGELEVVGMVDNIGTGEDIRSARFDGKRAFIVTFKKTDPLFAIDLSDPYAPRITGELKIPGFSTYMHFMDAQHLLTIGFDAQDEGMFAWFQGVMLQIFDVSDMTNPRLLHKEIIGTRGTTSEAATNHLAFTFFQPNDLLAVPMTICEESSGGGMYGDVMTFSGLLVYDVTVETGFVRVGGVEHVDPDNMPAGACDSWWTASNSVVKRSIFMDDFVYSVAPDVIKIQHVDQLGQDVASVSLTSN
jgi:uncharacterized secreted protein with C-terminal beta-propeller domain